VRWLDLKWFLGLLFILGIGVAIHVYGGVLTDERRTAATLQVPEAAMPVVAGPSGQWVALEQESCKSQLRVRFGRDIMMSAPGESQPLARNAVFRAAPNGQLRLSFEADFGGRNHPVTIIYEQRTDKLTPQAVSVDRGEFRTSFPEGFRRNYTYLRCSA